MMNEESTTSTTREEQPDQNLEDEIEEETELTVIEMEDQCDKEEGIHNENIVYSSLEDANRVRVEDHPHTFVGRSRYSEKGLILWNDLQEKIKNDLDNVETQGTVHFYQALLKIVQYTEDIQRSAKVIFDNIASIAQFHNDEKAQAIFKYSKKSFQRQADRLCAFYKLPKDRNSLSGEDEIKEEEEEEEEGNLEMEVGLIEEDEEEEELEEVKEEDNEQDNTLKHSNQEKSFTDMTDQNDAPSSSTSSTPVVLTTGTHSEIDDITKTATSSITLPPTSALLSALTSPSLPLLPSSDSSPSLHNSPPPSNSISSAVPPQSIIAATSKPHHSPPSPLLPPNIPHSPSNSVANPSIPSTTARTSSPHPHSIQSRIDSSPSLIPPSPVIAPSSRLLSPADGSHPLKRIRVEAASSDPTSSSTPSPLSRKVQIRISPDAKKSTPTSVGHPNTPATSRHPQSMPFPADYAQKAAWFQQMTMSQGMSQFPTMSPHQMMHFYPGMMMQRKIAVSRPTAPQMTSQPGPSTPLHPNAPQTAPRPPTGNQATSSPNQKQMQNEMIQRLMCGQNRGKHMMSPPHHVNGGHQPGRQMMTMMPHGQQLSIQQMQQFQQQQYYQAMMAQQMQFMQQNRPQ